MQRTRYPIDYSAILYLAQMRRHHTNVYRFTLTMKETVCPELLQKAADNLYTRFPTIFSGFQFGFFSCCMVPAQKAPRVLEDPGILHTMSAEEIRSCAYRIFYSENRISIEIFHAVTDGYGAVASLQTLAAEYLYLRYGISSPERRRMLENGQPDWDAELRDAYLDYAGGKSVRQPNRKAYQIRGEDRSWQPKASVRHFSTQELLAAARRQGVSLTAMLSCLMAEAIMEIQQRHGNGTKRKPVRIMVPVDLRRQFPSHTLRNFILYALPTMECDSLPRTHRMIRFQAQLRQQTARETLEPQITANVAAQRMLLFRVLPLKMKLAALRLAYRFFGESNSSITLTNLGPLAVSEELKSHIRHADVLLTPRCQSPYNCGVITCGDTTSITITRFGARPELEPLFYEKLSSILA